MKITMNFNYTQKREVGLWIWSSDKTLPGMRQALPKTAKRGGNLRYSKGERRYFRILLVGKCSMTWPA